AVCAADPAAALAAFRRHPAAVRTLEAGADSCTVQTRDGLRLRAFAAPPERFGGLLVRATGSDAHVARLRALAVQRGLAHDAGGTPAWLHAGGEGEVYHRLGLPWIAPELREDGSEVDGALAGRLPHDLLTEADVRGMVHCHTEWSDGRDSILAMARAAEALGMEYITITDHSPSAHYADGLSVERLRAQADEIAAVQEQVGIRLLHGSEVDILADGALDFPDDVLARLDVVIASVHHRHRLDPDAATRRLIAALRHPCFKIWGHPLGRYLRGRPPIACDMRAVLDAAAESRVAIEVNGDPFRLDAEPQWQR